MWHQQNASGEVPLLRLPAMLKGVAINNDETRIIAIGDGGAETTLLGTGYAKGGI